MHKFVSIKEAFDTSPGLAKTRDAIKEIEVTEKFFSIFPEMKKVIVLVNVIKKVLLLKVESSVLRSELKLNESVMIDKINKYFKDERIKSIRFIR
jgi:hypothetical protein